MPKVYIVDGCRTPYLKAGATPGPFSGADLAVRASRHLLMKHAWASDAIDEVIMGCVMPQATEANIARIIGLRLGLNQSIPAWTVQRNCASGLQALDSALKDIQLGRAHCVLAGGVEAMSYAPLLYNDEAKAWFGRIMTSKSLSQKLKGLAQVRPRFLKPVVALLCGLTDPVVELNMGQTAEVLASQFGISRDDMDAFSVSSHHKLLNAYEQGYMKEVIGLYGPDGKVYERDTGLREDSSVDKLAKLKPVFDKHYGSVTPGNSSQVTDGAAVLLLASVEFVQRHNLTPLAEIEDCSWAGLSPSIMGLGPVHASTKLLKSHNLTLSDIDIWEINEAFAAQILACRAAWLDDGYCRDELGLSSAFGELNLDKVNLDGGAVAVGHPVGSSGARVALHLCHVLAREGKERGVASLCIGGGQGGAMLIKRTQA